MAALLWVIPPFDGERAMRHVDEQIAFGPRVPGSEAHGEMLAWLTDTLSDLAATVRRRPFLFTSPLTGEKATCTNVIASFRPELRERIFLGAHWDSRAWADKDPDPAKRKDPVPGANDGASGVAVLLTLAETMKKSPPPVGVDLLFFDAEDQGTYGDETSFCRGAQQLAASAALTGFRPRFGIVIDLVGGKSARFRKEQHGLRLYPEVTNALFEIFARSAPALVDLETPIEIYDDHVPFMQAGIPCALIFGGGGAEWHTTADLPEHCSPGSLAAVGDLLMEVVYGEHKIP